MPDLKNATEWQRSFLSEVERALATRAQHAGPNDDHYKFTKSGIYGYVKLFSIKARTNPSGGVKVIVQELPWSLARTDLAQGNDWYGKPSRHRVFEAGDPQAAAISSTILSAARDANHQA